MILTIAFCHALLQRPLLANYCTQEDNNVDSATNAEGIHFLGAGSTVAVHACQTSRTHTMQCGAVQYIIEKSAVVRVQAGMAWFGTHSGGSVCLLLVSCSIGEERFSLVDQRAATRCLFPWTM